jgi:hypothetical protein
VFLYEESGFEVEIRNARPDVLEIRTVVLDCACADVKLDALRLQPGEATRLTGRLQGRRKPGAFARGRVFLIEEPERCGQRLAIVGEARRRISYTAEKLLWRPSFSSAKPGRGALTIRNGSDEAVELKLAGTGPSGIAASIDKPRLAPNESCRVSVEADPALVTARTLELQLDCSHALESAITVPVEVRPAEGVSLVPDSIAFGVLSREALMRRRSVVIDVAGDLVPHCDIEVASCPRYLRVDGVEPKTPDNCRVALAFQDSFERADLRGTIALRLRDRKSKQSVDVEVNVSGFLTDATGRSVE